MCRRRVIESGRLRWRPENCATSQKRDGNSFNCCGLQVKNLGKILFSPKWEADVHSPRLSFCDVLQRARFKIVARIFWIGHLLDVAGANMISRGRGWARTILIVVAY